MNLHQRVVVVIAAGLALVVLSATVNRLAATPDGGWFAYAPCNVADGDVQTDTSFASRARTRSGARPAFGWSRSSRGP